MAQLVLGVAGALAFPALGIPGFLGASSAAVGFAAGSFVGAALFPPEQPKPSIDDLRAPRIEYGAAIPRVYGHPRLPPCGVVWQSDARAIENEVGGKGGLGGPSQTQITYRRDYLLLFASTDCGAIRRVWFNKKLVYSLAAEQTIEEADAMNAEPPWGEMTNHPGAADQLPDPTYEAAVGTGLVCAMRDRHTVLFKDVDLGGSTALPLFEIEFAGQGSVAPYQQQVFNVTFESTLADVAADPITPDVTNPDGNLSYITDPDPDLGDDIPPNTWLKNTRSFTGNASPLIKWSGDKLAPASGGMQVWEWQIRNPEPIVRDNPNSDVDQLLYFFRAASPVFSFGYRILSGVLYAYVVDGVAVNVGTDTTGQMRLTYASDGVGSTTYTLQINGTTVHSNTVATADFFIAEVRIGSWATVPGVQSYLNSYELDNLRMNHGATGPLLALVEPTLQAVVEAECALGGLAPTDVDAAGLASKTVAAYAVTQVTSPRNVIEALAGAYQFTAAEVGGVLVFDFLGGETVGSIPYEDLGADSADGQAERLPVTDGNDIEIAVQVALQYINTADDYQAGLETSDRLVSAGNNTTTSQLALGLTPTQAKRLADTLVLRGKVEAGRKFGPFAVNRDHAERRPGESVLLEDRYGNTYRARLTQRTDSAGVFTFNAVAEDPTVWSSAAETATAYEGTVLVQPKVATDFAVMDIPLLRDADDGVGLYVAGYGGDRWPGYFARRSNDDTAFTTQAESTRKATVGEASTVLGSFAGGYVFDETNTVTVVTSGGQFASYTRDQVLSGTVGAVLVGDEIIQACTAELVGGNTYTLSRLLRGLHGTEAAIATHAVGDRVVVLDAATLIRIAQDTGDIGRLQYWRGVTKGRADSTATSQSLVFAAESQRPWSVVDVRGARDAAGSLAVTWLRRTRKTVNHDLGLYPLGEESEQYDVLVYASGAYTTVTRTTRVTSPTWTYSDALQTADFGSVQGTVYLEIYQVSATAGRGHATRKTL